MFRSACLIFNPSSGQGNPVEELTAIRETLGSKIDLDIHPAHNKKHDIPQAISVAVEQNTDVIIAAGGDGTVADVAAALRNIQIPLGIIPRGTANNFATAVGIPQDIHSACDVILSGRLRTIDTAACNGKLGLLQKSVKLT